LLGELQDRIYRFICALLRCGGNIKDAMLDWLGGCLHANAGMSVFLNPFILSLLYQGSKLIYQKHDIETSSLSVLMAIFQVNLG